MHRSSLLWASLSALSLSLMAPAAQAQAQAQAPPAQTPPAQPAPADTAASDDAAAPVDADAPADVFAELPTSSGGLTADAAAARAVEVAPQVRVAEAARQQARSAADIGKVAFAPRLDLRASYTRLSDVNGSIEFPPELGGGSIEFPQPVNSFATRASLAVPISDYFLTILPAYRAGVEAADLAEHQVAAEKDSTAVRAREAFYNHVRVRASEIVVTDAVALLEAHIADLEALVGAGMATRADLMQARAQLAETKAQVAATRGAVQVTADVLRTLLALERGAEIAVDTAVLRELPTAAPESEALLSAALEQRADVQALRSLIRLNQHVIDARKGSRLPQLAVVGNVDYANPNQRIFPQQDAFRATWDISAVLSWSPNDFVSRGVDVDEAELELTRAKANLEGLSDQLSILASQAANDMRVALENLESTREGIEAAREAWRVRNDLLSAGETTPSDVLDAEAALRRAQLAQIDAHIAALLAHVQVQYVMGRATPQ
ncbi:outer membrane efflux protein [Haliangium ochraceum DSM 14365]|uniref:Outer membrane efflux protein n=2 Tax=Haliangium ochraceum TaxID=80816 RepID=D0LMK2_HALO1|nr:outer membrane efflux protein [Haliangium ochraceum DSM 14365]